MSLTGSLVDLLGLRAVLRFFLYLGWRERMIRLEEKTGQHRELCRYPRGEDGRREKEVGWWRGLGEVELTLCSR